MIRPLIRRRTFLASGAAVVAGFGTRSPAAVAAPPIVSLNTILQQLRARHLLPGAAALVLRSGWTIAQGVAGRRSAFEADPIRRPDQFLIGSCGKSMTATVVARLVQQGVITFETTLAELFPELRGRMWPGYRSVSLAARAGASRRCSGRTAAAAAARRRPGGRAGDGAAHHSGAATGRHARADLPLLQPGLYRGRRGTRPCGGHRVRAPRSPRAVRAAGPGHRRVSAPTGTDAPSGHTALGIPLPPELAALSAVRANPAGLYHLSLPDWAKYARLHMGLGPSTYLSATLLARLQRPWVGPGPHAMRWAGRWLAAPTARSCATTAATGTGRRGPS